MIKASVVGATGYTGAVLTDLLARHPEVELVALTSQSYLGKRVAEVFPQLRVEAEYVSYSVEAVRGSDVVFVCYPHAEAHPVVSEVLEAGCRVVDLSADFRLKQLSAYDEWYGFTHPRPDLVEEAVYGLPEIYREKIRTARLVANPGCYPTATLLALLPAVDQLGEGPVIVDAKSGVSGAGRTPSPRTHFCAVNENFQVYSEVGHRHTSEMLEQLEIAAGHPVRLSFTPHLLPVDRGILTTIYFAARKGLEGIDAWLALYRAYYANEPFVEVCDHVPSLAEVQRTNFCRLTVREDKRAGLVKVVSVIDNLVKGASGQAVQNMNCMFGLPEDAGLGRLV